MQYKIVWHESPLTDTLETACGNIKISEDEVYLCNNLPVLVSILQNMIDDLFGSNMPDEQSTDVIFESRLDYELMLCINEAISNVTIADMVIYKHIFVDRVRNLLSELGDDETEES